MKKWLLLPAALILLVFAAACAPAADAFAVKVDGQAIPMKDYNDFYAFYEAYYTQSGYDWENLDKSMLKQNILDTLIQDELLRELAAEKKWDLQSPEVEGELDSLKAQITAFGGDYDAWLTSNHRTDEKMRVIIAFQQNISQDENAVAPEALQQYFDENAASYYTPETVTASHILLSLDDEARARQLADDLQGADLATFAEAARKESIDEGSATNGGSVGTFGRGQMVTEFEDAAFSQEVGEVSAEPVQSRYGYHIIYVQDHQPEKAGTLEENIEQVRVMAYYADLLQKARIEYGPDMAPPPVEEISFPPAEPAPGAEAGDDSAAGAEDAEADDSAAGEEEAAAEGEGAG
ncbi:MAG: peptidylprolyl isomerase [Gracilibacteraceae bacterium]|jgi:peptidyl-prolyl cis-trans isomerase C|nr:peptidylprolyl isomerase [Gracilibacteraceae bacterium]